MPEKQTYIEHVHLSGYKSIKNVSCRFDEGLNIIIGNNGSGKTNLLEFVNKIINRDYVGMSFFKAAIKFFKGSGFIESKSLHNDGNDYFLWKAEGNISSEMIDHKKNGTEVSQPELDIFFYTEFVKFNLPEIGLLSKEINPKYNIEHRSLLLNGDEEKLPFSLSIWIRRIFHAEDFLKKSLQKDLTDNYLYEFLSIAFNRDFGEIKSILNNYTPVKDVRISNSTRVVNIDNLTLEFRNLVLEYKINGDWFPWDAISDGSKRLIYLIFLINGLRFGTDEQHHVFPITLVEEPEIGIHPHQLHLLLNFLKEKSKYQQIIITTHSPQVLDILGPDELNKIIIAEIDFENGTVLRHLNTEEMLKAQAYLKNEGLLSDYWRFSDLQRSNKAK